MRRSRFKATPNLIGASQNRARRSSSLLESPPENADDKKDDDDQISHRNSSEKENDVFAPSTFASPPASPATTPTTLLSPSAADKTDKVTFPGRLKARFKPNLTDRKRKRTVSTSSNDRGSKGRQRTTSTTSVEADEAENEDKNDAFAEPPVEDAIRPPSPTPSSVASAESLPDMRSPPPAVKLARRRVTEGAKPAEVENESLFDKRKADHKKRFTKGVPERSRLTVFDFIFHNPIGGSRMSARRDSSTTSSENGSPRKKEATAERALSAETVEPDEPEKEEEPEQDEAMPVPRVKIGPDGQIILDEDSTFIETSATKRAKEDLLKTPLVFENQGTNYGTWGKKRKTTEWGEKETLRFYKALSIFGTDFSMMAAKFKKRNRHDLKMKFKKEERTNRNLVDRCLSQNGQFDLSAIGSESEEEDDPDDPDEPKKKKGRAKKTKKPPAKKKESKAAEKKKKRAKSLRKSRGYYSSSSDDADVESEVASETDTGRSAATSATTPSISSPSPPSEQPMLRSLLSQPVKEGENNVFPPGLLAANPGLANATSGSLVVVASPSTGNQQLHVYMVDDAAKETASGRVRTISGSMDVPSSPSKSVDKS